MALAGDSKKTITQCTASKHVDVTIHVNNRDIVFEAVFRLIHCTSCAHGHSKILNISETRPLYPAYRCSASPASGGRGRPGSDGPGPGQARRRNRRALTCRGNCPRRKTSTSWPPCHLPIAVTICPATTIGSPISGRVWLPPELRDELLTEGRQIAGLAAGNEHVRPLGAHLYPGIYPGPACVPDIGLQARPRGQGPPAHQVCLARVRCSPAVSFSASNIRDNILDRRPVPPARPHRCLHGRQSVRIPRIGIRHSPVVATTATNDATPGTARAAEHLPRPRPTPPGTARETHQARLEESPLGHPDRSHRPAALSYLPSFRIPQRNARSHGRLRPATVGDTTMRRRRPPG